MKKVYDFGLPQGVWYKHLRKFVSFTLSKQAALDVKQWFFIWINLTLDSTKKNISCYASDPIFQC